MPWTLLAELSCISARVSLALAIALVIGKRMGFGSYVMEPHNIPMAMLGAGLLWFGWFGFNSGSALAANGLAASAFVVTNTSAAAGALAWLFASWFKGKPECSWSERCHSWIGGNNAGRAMLMSQLP